MNDHAKLLEIAMNTISSKKSKFSKGSYRNLKGIGRNATSALTT